MQDIIKTEEDIKFDQILEAEGYDIKSFYMETPHNLFQNARSYPQFFNQNLVSPCRVIKQFINNPQSCIRIFYFQLLHLSYQIQTTIGFNRNFLRNLIRIVFNSQFEIFFTSDTKNQRDVYNDFQFKKLFAEFIQLLENQQSPNIEQIVNHFPIIDTIFIYIFRSILNFQNVQVEFNEKIPSQILFPTLSQMLGLNISLYEKCWKFQDSDMYCYQQNEEQIYLAYLVQSVGQQKITRIESQNMIVIDSNNNLPQNEQIFIIPNSQLSDINRNQRESMLSETYQFVDFTNTSTFYKQKKPKDSIKSHDYSYNEQHLYVSNVVPTTPLFNQNVISIPVKINQQYQEVYYQIPNLQNTQKQKNNRNQNIAITKLQIPNYFSNMNDVYQIQQTLVIPHQVMDDQATPIYKLSNNHKLKQATQQLKISESIQSNPSTINQLGDYYKDFTNSFTLQKINEPSRTNIRNIKNRMKGLRRSGINPQNYFNYQQLNKFPQANKISSYNDYSTYSNHNTYSNHVNANFSKNNKQSYKMQTYINYQLPKTNYYY